MAYMIDIVEADLAASDHASALLRLLNEYALDPMGGGRELSRYAKDHLSEALRRRQGAHVLLAYLGGCPAGLLIGFEGFSTFACRPLLNIHDVIVTLEHRRKGIAGRLLQSAEAIARRNNCCKVTLEVLAGNQAALALYRRMGYAGFELDPHAGQAMFWQKSLSETDRRGAA